MVSSVIVPSNVILTLYDYSGSFDTKFKGNSYEIDGTKQSKMTTGIEMKCINLPDFDNKTKSLKLSH